MLYLLREKKGCNGGVQLDTFSINQKILSSIRVQFISYSPHVQLYTRIGTYQYHQSNCRIFYIAKVWYVTSAPLFIYLWLHHTVFKDRMMGRFSCSFLLLIIVENLEPVLSLSRIQKRIVVLREAPKKFFF